MKWRFILLFIIGFRFVSAAQTGTPIHNLVFEGAGIRGIAYAGAINELEAQNLLSHIQRVGGTSAGAITALLLSLGYTADEITRTVNTTSFKKFNDGRYFFLGGINRMQQYYGWYRGQRFEKWLSQLIAAKTGNADITFRQLHQQGYKDLYVTATNLTKQQLVILSFEAFPHMKVKDAVRISMSIPLYFEAVFMDSTGKIYHHPKNKTGLDIMVDGGIAGNFPIHIFDSTKYIYPEQSNGFMYNPQTVGFRIDSKDQIQKDSSHKELAAIPVRNLRQYITAFYTIVIENLNRQTLTNEDWKRTISISDGSIGHELESCRLQKYKCSWKMAGKQ